MVKSHCNVPCGVSTSRHYAMVPVAYRPVITHHFVPYSVFCPCGVSTNQHFVPCGVSTIYHFAMFHVAYLPAITLQYSMWLIKQPSHLLYSMRLIKLPSLCHVPCGLSNSNHFAMFHVAFGVSNSNHFAMFHVVHRQPSLTMLHEAYQTANHFAVIILYGVSNSSHFAMFHVAYRPAITLLCRMWDSCRIDPPDYSAWHCTY